MADTINHEHQRSTAGANKLRRRVRRALLGLCLLLSPCAFVSCGRETVSTPEQTTELSATADPVAANNSDVTFNQVAPIVWEKCSCCHRPGESAPFPLLVSDDFQTRRQQILDVLASGYMPPWLPQTHDVAYANDLRLSDSEQQMVQSWLQDGAPEGDPRQLPELPTWPAGWQLGEPDLVVSMSAPFELPAQGPDVYRNFVIPIPVDRIRYVRAMEFRPGNHRVVHHAFMMIDTTRRLRRLCQQDGQPGFGGMDTQDAASPGGHFIGWQPGRRPYAADEDMAWRLIPGTDLVLQVHMQCTGKPEQIAASVGFYFTDKPPTKKPVKIVLRSAEIDIPAGQKDYEIRDEFQIPVAMDVLAVAPHAHYLGQEMHATAELPSGETKTLLTILDWDLNWQSEYRFQTPIHLPAGTTLRQRFVYNNSTENPRNPHQPPQRVTFGPQATDEMGSVWLQGLVSNPAELPVLNRAVLRKSMQESLRLNQRRLQLDPQDAEANMTMGKIALAVQQYARATEYFRRVASNSLDAADALYYWGQALLRSGKTDEGLEKLNACIALDPEHFRAFYDLGYASCLSQDFVTAERWFRQAIKLQPYDTRSLKQLAKVMVHRNDRDEAVELLQTSLLVDPDDEEARKLLQQLGSRPDLR